MKIFIKNILIQFRLLNITSRILYRIKNYGSIKGLLIFIKEDMRWLFYNYLFDKKLGIETFSNIEVQNLGIDDFKKKYANRYQPVSLKHLEISLDLLIKKKNNEYDIFIDIGCGKGKPIFYALKFYPKIKEFIGIDISKKVIEIANLNLTQIKKKNKLLSRSININFLGKDALKYKFKNDKRYLIFMFNPFNKDYFETFFLKNKSLFNKSNFDFIIVNSPSVIISYLDLMYHDKKITLEIYGKNKFK